MDHWLWNSGCLSSHANSFTYQPGQLTFLKPITLLADNPEALTLWGLNELKCTELSTVRQNEGMRKAGRRKKRWWQQALQIHYLQKCFAPFHHFFTRRLHHSLPPKQYFAKRLVFCGKLFLSHSTNTYPFSELLHVFPIHLLLTSHFSWTFISKYIRRCVYNQACIYVCKSTQLSTHPLKAGTSFIHKLDGSVLCT